MAMTPAKRHQIRAKQEEMQKARKENGPDQRPYVLYPSLWKGKRAAYAG